MAGGVVSERTYRVVHRTTYRYSATMSDGYTVCCVQPRDTDVQHVVGSEVRVEPTATSTVSYRDVFGNVVHQFGIHQPHAEMAVVATSTVTVERRPDPVDTTAWEAVVAQLEAATGEVAIDVTTFRGGSYFVDLVTLGEPLRAIATAAFTPGRGIVAAAADMCRQIQAGYEFDAGFSNVSTPLADVLAARRGVCQDFAHLAVGALRSIGLAARYVSGYIETQPPPGEPRLAGADASHAWCSVWTPRAGWVDFDPTNGHLPVNDHVTIGWGRDYSDVTPVRGVMIGPATDQFLDVAVDVERL
ncbi:MAG TPA: transglutaminase family protein [Ilumatobacter sp.]|nr:transglutaminase family protein [Ilumatobacter sp.]